MSLTIKLLVCNLLYILKYVEKIRFIEIYGNVIDWYVKK